MNSTRTHTLCFLCVLIATCTGCNFFTNDSGQINPRETIGIDLSIEQIEAPLSARMGQEIDFRVTLKHTGENAIVKPVTITLSHVGADSVIHSFMLPDSMATDTSITVTLQWDTENVPAGIHPLSIAHNFEDDNPDNNLKQFELTLTTLQEVDLAIVGFNVPEEITPGMQAEIMVTVGNIGFRRIDDDINVILMNQTQDILIGAQRLNGDLESGETRSFTFMWDTGETPTGRYRINARHTFIDNTPQNNSTSKEIEIKEVQIADGADIAITHISAPQTAPTGSDVEIAIQIQNAGNAETSQGIILLLMDDQREDTLDTATLMHPLAPGSTSELTFTWNTNALPAGEYTLYAGHNLEDSNAQNNWLSTTIALGGFQQQDVAITSFSGPDEVFQGQTAELSFVVSNTGQLPVEDEDIEITIINESYATVIDYRQISPPMGIGESREFNISWDTPAARPGEHLLMARHSLNDAIADNNSMNLAIQVFEQESELSVERFEPDQMRRNTIEEITVTGSGFKEDIQIEFYRNGNNDDRVPPEVLEIDFEDENTLRITVRTWWWNRRNQNWHARFTQGDNETFEFTAALRVTN